MLSWKYLPMETNRLLIRRLSMRDARAIYKIFSCEETMKACGLNTICTIEEAIELTRQLMNNDELAIVSKDSNCLIGTVGFIAMDECHQRVELGFELLSDYRRNGYMKEALEVVVQALFVFEPIHRIEAYTHGDNQAAWKLLESIGFVKEGMMRKRNYVHGVFRDCRIYALLKHADERSVVLE